MPTILSQPLYVNKRHHNNPSLQDGMEANVDFYLHKSDGIMMTPEKYFDQILIEEHSVKNICSSICLAYVNCWYVFPLIAYEVLVKIMWCHPTVN